MPIVFVHGVATRIDDEGYQDSWTETAEFLRHYIAPAVSGKPDKVAVIPAYWGDVAAKFRCGGISRPRTPLLGQGATLGASGEVVMMAELGHVMPANGVRRSLAPGGGLVAAGPRLSSDPSAVPVRQQRLVDLDPDAISDLAVAAMPPGDGNPICTARWAMCADAVARDPATRAALNGLADPEEEIRVLFSLVQQDFEADGGQGAELAGMGAGGDWIRRWRTGIVEAVSRAGTLPGFAVSRAVGEARGPLNDLATGFIGDVFVYLAGRSEDDGSPGPIPGTVLTALRRAHAERLSDDEPIIVITHSMGGQIVYDLVTHFLPQQPDGDELRVDFWCATASQVGLFEEMSLFLNSDQARVGPSPRPSRAALGYWWNVWDYNDFISYSVKGIIEGADDESYSSGLSVLGAHSGYLRRPSFYRKLARKVESAGLLDWGRG